MKSKRIVKTPKKVKNVKAPEYAFGGSVHDPLNDYLMIQKQRASNMPNQIESPDTALVDNEIRLARAAQKAENNPWTQGLDLFGNLAMQVGSSMMSQGASKGQGVSKGGFNWGSLLQQGVGAMGTFANSSYATGGKVPINAEGGEIIETPGGEPQELQGDSHAEGGINLQVPEGTEIYSKRLKGPDGKSMADRKKARERQLAKLEKLAESNPTDKTIRKTLEKTKKDFQIQEQQDMQKMQMMHQMTQMQQAMEHFATGGKAGKPLPSYWTGTNGVYPMTEEEEALTRIQREQPIFENPSVVINNKPVSYNSKPTLPVPEEVNSAVSNGTNSTTENKYDWLNNIFGKGDGLTVGDMIGLGGQLYSTFAPMKNTQANRAGDTPNVNAFKEYGKEGLKSLDKSKQYVNQIRDENLKDLELTRTGQINRNRNSARGINTQRALDLTADANVNNTKAQIYNQFLSAMQGIYSQESQMKNQQDQVVMQGEQNRDLADRHDRDNYFSQLAKDIASKGEGLQHIGKNINEVKSRSAKSKELDKQLKMLKNSGEINSQMIQDLISTGHTDIAMAMLLQGSLKGKKQD